MAKYSMYPGLTERTVQIGTVRTLNSAFVNLYQASVDNTSTAIIGGKYGGNQLVIRVKDRNALLDGRQGGPGLRFVQKGDESDAGDSGGAMSGTIGGSEKVGNS
jgi:hypothetical protein